MHKCSRFDAKCITWCVVIRFDWYRFSITSSHRDPFNVDISHPPTSQHHTYSCTFRKYWPDAKLIVGIRHPVRWFESLYNFRLQNLSPNNTMPDPLQLIGKCQRGSRNTCTDKGNFAYSLMKLGKQNFPRSRPPTQLEEQIIGGPKRFASRGWYNVSAVRVTPNPVFLFELDQLADSDPTRSRQFRTDLERFMGFQHQLSDLVHYKPGKDWSDESIQKVKDGQKIDICRDEYEPVRRRLMELSRMNSQWIRSVFLQSPTVHVSSRKHLVDDILTRRWMRDPCDDDDNDHKDRRPTTTTTKETPDSVLDETTVVATESWKSRLDTQNITWLILLN